ncbi:LLM class flavin-dependent oxidoreductase [Roseomonas hellenica]|uniref:LLM class flavin-dependent oxidoreductase n=1 Tax=Plastoroseomonas hellenica TaxID=2687306 RepID=A0ABS5F625_9PROT|nr:LLM class flavin-dependent oxidoreductase [Plastoroseomonas hellenica]MBR0668008.1 LLM class flavin-dependent oxidoreductase [Plastoroseomonas hellenica]
MASHRQIRLGVSMIGLGYHLAAWRHPDAPAGGNMELQHFVRVTQAAERGLFDMAFLADGVGIRFHDEPPGALCHTSKNVQFEPLTLLSALAMVTERIGLVATASTTYNEPYHVARKFASLDHISDGRAGWNVVTSVTDMEARNFNRDKAPGYDARYDRAAEFVEVVRGLWESWEDDAFVRDKASGLNYDPGKLHVLDHHGPHFQVRGPLNVARTPQGAPVIVQAGASEQGRELAAATADVVYAAAQRLEDAQAYYASVKGRMARYGRAPEALKIMPGIMAVPGRTRQEAEDKYAVLQELVQPVVGLGALSNYLGDLSGFPLEGPVPEPTNRRMHSRAQIFLDIARRGGLSIRQLYLAVAGGNGHRLVIGTPVDIADAMEEWFLNGAADGFNILPPWLPGGLEDVVEMVVPELQRRGLYRTGYESRTLRGNLGIAWPEHRRAGVKRAAIAQALGSAAQ